MNVTCPTCQDSFEVKVLSVIPQTQIMHMKLVSETDLFDADMIGRTIQNFVKLQREFGKTFDIKIECFLQSIELKPKEITIGFCIVQRKDQT